MLQINVNDFEQKYTELHYRLQQLQWENYFNDSSNDLNEIDDNDIDNKNVETNKLQEQKNEL